MKGYTIQNSINLLEKNATGGGPSGPTSAESVTFDNTGTEIVATNVQAAITELKSDIDNVSSLDIYSTNEAIVGKWIDNKDVYQKVVNFGALPNATNKSVAHGITNLDMFISCEAMASNELKNTFPLPLTQLETTTIGYQIQVSLDDTNITMSTLSDRSSYTNCYVILRYTKTANNTRKKK